MAFVVTWVANALAIYAAAYVMSSQNMAVSSFRDALIAGLCLTIVNAIVKPILLILTLPLTIVTLGLFYFFIAAFCLWLTAWLVPGFVVHGLLTTIVAAILVSVFSALIHRILARETGHRAARR